jgi:hypothetical protein
VEVKLSVVSASTISGQVRFPNFFLNNNLRYLLKRKLDVPKSLSEHGDGRKKVVPLPVMKLRLSNAYN